MSVVTNRVPNRNGTKNGELKVNKSKCKQRMMRRGGRRGHNKYLVHGEKFPIALTTQYNIWFNKFEVLGN